MRYKYLERKKCTSKWEEAGRETRCSDVAVRDEVKNHSVPHGTLSRS